MANPYEDLIRNYERRIRALEETLTALQMPLLTGTWTDYSGTSTIVGWSSFTKQDLSYVETPIQGGLNLMFVLVNLVGTSDSTSTSFTVPSANASGIGINCYMRVQDSGTYQPAGLATIVAASDVVNVYTDSSAAAWTASGTKSVRGGIWYVS